MYRTRKMKPQLIVHIIILSQSDSICTVGSSTSDESLCGGFRQALALSLSHPNSCVILMSRFDDVILANGSGLHLPACHAGNDEKPVFPAGSCGRRVVERHSIVTITESCFNLGTTILHDCFCNLFALDTRDECVVSAVVLDLHMQLASRSRDACSAKTVVRSIA